MKKILLGCSVLAMLTFAVPASIHADPKPVRLFLSPRSTVPPPEILKHLGSHCPNVALTSEAKRSDYMLVAWGWSGNYRFTLFQHGGDIVYGTSTVMLSNAVKDVCKYVNGHPGEAR